MDITKLSELEIAENCPGQRDLLILNYYQDIYCNAHISSEGYHEGSIAEGDMKGFCFDNLKCNAITRKKRGVSYYHILQNDEIFDVGWFEYGQAFGTCQVTRNHTNLLVSTNPNNGNFSFDLLQNSSAVKLNISSEEPRQPHVSAPINVACFGVKAKHTTFLSRWKGGR